MDENDSKGNKEEVEAIRMLLRDKESSKTARPTIITYYSFQKQLLEEMLKNEGFDDVSVLTVDSAQGTEHDNLVLSLVRTTRPGFLKDLNSCCGCFKMHESLHSAWQRKVDERSFTLGNATEDT